MKKTTLFKTACLSLMVGLIACSKDLNTGTIDPIDEGEPTLMALTLSFPAPEQTRADDSATGLADESKISTFDVFIYGSNRLWLATHSFTVDDFTIVDNTYTAKKLIKTTVGLKYVFVAANLPGTIKSKIETVMDAGTLTNDGYTIGRTLLTGENEDAFIMCGSSLLAQTLQSYAVTAGDRTDQIPPGNIFDVKLIRLASKVTVVEGATLEKSIRTGTLSELNFAIDHYNNQSYLIQGNAPNYADPNWDMVGWKKNSSNADVASIVDSKFWGDLSKKAPGDAGYKVVNANGTAFETLNKEYVAENTSEPGILLRGTLTRLIVRAKFTPKHVYEADPTHTTFPEGYKEVDGPAAPQTFYMILGSNGQEYYTLNQADINGLSLAVGASATDSYLTYTDGYCYYSLWLNSSDAESNKVTRYQPLRNQYYACTITKVNAIGSDQEILQDPEMPMIEPETNIAVDVNVKSWDVVTNDYVLDK
jgi:hypothetical protein